MARSPRVRLDELLVSRGLADTRSKARGLIMAGLVRVDGVVVDKSGAPIAQDADVAIAARPRFVCRGGDKLAHALEVFRLNVKGKDSLDVGSSTGGFVDCLLQSGAARVIALDVGYGQLSARLRADPRVIVMERTNARYLRPGDLPFRPDFITLDVSFISLQKVLPPVVDAAAEIFHGLALVKPQFEAGRSRVGKGGIVRDPAVHREVLGDIGTFLLSTLKVNVAGLADSGLLGAEGNREFFYVFNRGGEEGISLATLEENIVRVVEGR